MATTYYTIVDPDTGETTKAQQRKLGTAAYGYKSVAMALRYAPAGWQVQERYCDGADDWGGHIVATKPE